jgi:NAD+ synthetase
MKIMLAQINTTPNDFVGNYNKIIDGIEQAKAEGCKLAVFPELSICGYGVKDLVYKPGFIEKNSKTLREIIDYSSQEPVSGITIVVGYIDENTTGEGKPFRNMAAVIRGGRILCTYQKRLLPFYDVFDEGRWFEPGKENAVFDIDGVKWGVIICEDGWHSDKGETGLINHHVDPLQSYKDIGVKNIVSLNSSPYYHGKDIVRLQTFRDKCTELGFDLLVYCNQSGGQDELVFDGNGFVVGKDSYIHDTFQSAFPRYGRDTFNKEYFVVDTEQGGISVSHSRQAEYLRMAVVGLQDYARKTKQKKFVIGSSGGVDSALVISLACIAFGPENVTGIRMPSAISSQGSKDDALRLHQNWGCKDLMVSIDHQDFLAHVNSGLGLEQGNYHAVADENIQARMRGQIVMHYSNATGALPLTTGNKTELSLGYCTLYGDMSGGFNPIGDMYKYMVYEMCKLINEFYGNKIPKEIIEKAPSAELAPGQTDEKSLMPYRLLDKIVEEYVENYICNLAQFKAKIEKTGLHTSGLWALQPEDITILDEKYDQMIRRTDNCEFKRRQAAPCIKLTKKSFGTGRRMPIARG